jgi:hypothetical protein
MLLTVFASKCPTSLSGTLLFDVEKPTPALSFLSLPDPTKCGDDEELRGLALTLRKGALAQLLSHEVDASSLKNTRRLKSATYYSASPATWVSRASSETASMGL